MALLAVQQVQITGTTPSYGAVAATDTLVPDDGAFLIVKNVSGSADTCTIVTPGSTFGQANPDVVVTVPATTGERWIGPMVPELADPATGLITVTHAPQASITCAYVRVS